MLLNSFSMQAYKIVHVAQVFVQIVDQKPPGFLTRILARVLNRVWGKEKTVNTVYSTTRPQGKNLKNLKRMFKNI